MDFLQTVFGGGQAQQRQQQQQQYEDFMGRYDRGDPYDNISDDEVLQRYEQVSRHVPANTWEEAATDSFSRLTPQQRMQLGRYLIQSAQRQGHQVPDANRDGVDDRMQDPRYLAQVAGRMRQQQPGLFSQILGGSMGGGLAGRAAPTGVGTPVGGAGNMGEVLNSPIARAALAGIATMAMRRMMTNR